MISAAALINRIGTMALPFLTLYLTRSLGWSATRAAFIVTLYGAVSCLVGPLAGRMVDEWGTRSVMLWSIFLSGAIMLVFPLAHGFGSVAAMTVVWALVTEGFRPANMTAIAESAPPERRKQAYALHRAAVNLGMSVGPAVGGFLAVVSFPLIWLVDGATSLAAGVVLLLAVDAFKPSASRDGSKASVRTILRDSRMMLCLTGSVLVSIVFFQHISALPLHLVQDLRLSESFYGVMFTVNTLVIFALEIPLNHRTALWPYRLTLSLGAALFALGFGAYALSRTGWSILAATIIWTFGEMILFPGMTAYVAAIAPESKRGAYMGVYLTAFSVGFMVAPAAGVSIMEVLGPRALWACCFVTAGLGALLLARIPADDGAAA